MEQELQPISRLLLTGDPDESLVLAVPGLRQALTHLGHITGREYHEELLDQVFSTFCIGK
jgi:tRNA U34 5-carboxymethylaminomethyl modifying GTPase MnmE/TrmE